MEEGMQTSDRETCHTKENGRDVAGTEFRETTHGVVLPIGCRSCTALLARADTHNSGRILRGGPDTRAGSQ